MFTGIVRAVGRVSSIRDTGGDLRLTVRAAGLPWPKHKMNLDFLKLLLRK